MEPEGLLPHSQNPITCPNPEPDQSSPCHTSHFLKIHLNIIFSSAPALSKWSLSLRFPHQCPVYTPHLLPIVVHARPIPFLSIWSPEWYSVSSTDNEVPHTNLTDLLHGAESFLRSSSLCSLLHSPVTSSLLGPNILLNTMFSNTLSFLSSRNVSDQVSHP